MLLAGKHSIDIRTSGRVFARTAHQHSRFRATTSPSTSWQTLWQHSNSSLWHCHTDFHAGYQHKWHNAITVLCSKYHFNIGWTNITLNIAKNISIHITSHRLQLDIGRTVAAAVSCQLHQLEPVAIDVTGAVILLHQCHRIQCHLQSSNAILSSFINFRFNYRCHHIQFNPRPSMPISEFYARGPQSHYPRYLVLNLTLETNQGY